MTATKQQQQNHLSRQLQKKWPTAQDSDNNTVDSIKNNVENGANSKTQEEEDEKRTQLVLAHALTSPPPTTATPTHTPHIHAHTHTHIYINTHTPRQTNRHTHTHKQTLTDRHTHTPYGHGWWWWWWGGRHGNKSGSEQGIEDPCQWQEKQMEESLRLIRFWIENQWSLRRSKETRLSVDNLKNVRATCF